jgi:hypothetical protein
VMYFIKQLPEILRKEDLSIRKTKKLFYQPISRNLKKGVIKWQKKRN